MRSVFGITGGTGCGKTTVLSVLEKLGFTTIDCDALYHQMLAEGGALVDKIREMFPGTVHNGVLQRKKLGSIVFADPKALERLSAVTDRAVDQRVEALIAAAPGPVAVDAIRLFESGLAARCSCTIAVTAPAEVRVRRLMAREGISEDYARLRIDAQPDDGVFADLADVVLVNDFPTRAEFEAYCREKLEKLL